MRDMLGRVVVVGAGVSEDLLEFRCESAWVWAVSLGSCFVTALILLFKSVCLRPLDFILIDHKRLEIHPFLLYFSTY